MALEALRGRIVPQEDELGGKGAMALGDLKWHRRFGFYSVPMIDHGSFEHRATSAVPPDGWRAPPRTHTSCGEATRHSASQAFCWAKGCLEKRKDGQEVLFF